MSSSSNVHQLLDTFDHVVVLMLENRSFDNLLGNLYPNGVPTGKKYAGLQEGSYPNPVPSRAIDSDQYKTISPLPAQDYFQPFPDPGEVYQHVNTQLWNFINKKDPNNVGIDESKMKPPYNIPTPTPLPSMNGFVNDYQNTLLALDAKKYPDYADPDYDKYSVIMQTYSAGQVSVLSSLAQHFAVFDHWHCSVPSQTWCNRAFWHAGTSGGRVINPIGEGGWSFADWIDRVWTKSTIFDRFEKKGITWNVYAPWSVSSLTYLIHGLYITHPLHLHGFDKFQRHIDEGKLPQYSFLEPQYFGAHNDQHPSSIGKGFIDYKHKVGSVLLGEKLIHDVYNSIKNSDTYRKNTLLIITHDEHGGCFDHVVPGPTVAPEDDKPTEKGFDFKRLGIRVPMIMISDHIHPDTIINSPMQHTSFLATMETKWNLEPLTRRDSKAPTFESVFSLESRKAWPEITSPLIPPVADESHDEDELNDLQKSIIYGLAQVVDYTKKSNLAAQVLESVTTNKAAIDFLKEHQSTLGVD